MTVDAPAGSRSLRALPLVLVGAAVLFGLVLLRRDFLSTLPETNDRVLHDALVRECARCWEDVFPADFWFAPITTGFPMFAHYQPLSHLLAVAAARAAGADPVGTYHALSWLLLATVPIVAYASFRKMGIPPWGAAIGAVCVPLVRTRPSFGLGWESFTSSGSGLIPQLWSTWFVFPALAWGWDAVRGEERSPREQIAAVAAASLPLAACTLTHTIFGYAVAISLAIAALVPGRRLLRRLTLLAGVGLVTAALTAWFAIPLASMSREVLRSQWEPWWKWNSIGLRAVLADLATGTLFDGTGIPALSFAVGAGIVVAAARAGKRADALSRFALAGFVAWILLFAGRTTWGRLIDLLPLASGLHLHRFVAVVQLFGLLLAAIGAGAILNGPRRRVVGGALALAVVIAVPVASRAASMAENDRRVAARRAALAASRDLAAAIERLRALPEGRVYAGSHADWGAKAVVDDVPVYAILQQEGFDMIGYPFMAMAFPAEWQVRTDFARADALDLWGVRWILAPEGAPVASVAVPRESFGPWRLYEVPAAGRFALGRVERLPVGGRPRTWPEVYAAGKAWLDGPATGEGRYAAFLAPAPEPIAGAVHGAILSERAGCGRYGASVAMETPGDLVLKVTRHPGWRCRVDGRPVPIVPVFPGFSSVRLEPGRHEVEFVYVPASGKRGLLVLASVVAAGALAAAFAGKRRRGRDPSLPI